VTENDTAAMIMLRNGRKEDEMPGAREGRGNEIYCALGPIIRSSLVPRYIDLQTHANSGAGMNERALIRRRNGGSGWLGNI
jgi:hypothetical protein